MPELDIDKPKRFYDFGWANGWAENPKLVQKCRRAHHLGKDERVGRCSTRYTCDICGYTYRVDSSD